MCAASSADLISEKEKEIALLKAKMAEMEAAVQLAKEEGRKAALREAANVIAEAELSDLLQPNANTWPADVGKVQPTTTGANDGLPYAPSFDNWLNASALPPLPAHRPRRDKRRRNKAAYAAAQSAVDAAIGTVRATQMANGPRPELVSKGAKREVRYTRYGSAPRDFPEQMILALIEKRITARLKKHYSEADRIQKRLNNLGVRLDDRRRTWSVIKGWRKMQQAEALVESQGYEADPGALRWETDEENQKGPKEEKPLRVHRVGKLEMRSHG